MISHISNQEPLSKTGTKDLALVKSSFAGGTSNNEDYQQVLTSLAGEQPASEQDLITTTAKLKLDNEHQQELLASVSEQEVTDADSNVLALNTLSTQPSVAQFSVQTNAQIKQQQVIHGQLPGDALQPDEQASLSTLQATANAPAQLKSDSGKLPLLLSQALYPQQINHLPINKQQLNNQLPSIQDATGKDGATSRHFSRLALSASSLDSDQLNQSRLVNLSNSELRSAKVIDAISGHALAAEKPALVSAGRVLVDATGARIETALLDAPLSERGQNHTARYEWSAVKLDVQQQNWSKQLVNVLQDRIQMQASQQIKQVNIRLDPADLGRLDINIRTDGERMSVTLLANNSALRDALLESSERLGAGLAQQFGSEVDVNVSDDSLAEQLKESDEQVALSIDEDKASQTLTSSTSSAWLNTLA